MHKHTNPEKFGIRIIRLILMACEPAYAESLGNSVHCTFMYSFFV